MKFTDEDILSFIERLNIVKDEMKAVLDDWPIASQIYEYEMSIDMLKYLLNNNAN